MKKQLKEFDEVYYIENYIPYRDFKKYSDMDLAFSKEIWAYKQGEEPAVTFMTEKYIDAIKELIKRKPMQPYIGLVSAPPSKVGKYSPVSESIRRIYKYYMSEKRKGRDPFCGHQIRDFRILLKRTKDLPVSHTEKRATYTDHKQTIACAYDELNKYHASYIIMDDIVTSGRLLNICEDILMEHGVTLSNIYKLVLAKTI